MENLELKSNEEILTKNDNNWNLDTYDNNNKKRNIILMLITILIILILIIIIVTIIIVKNIDDDEPINDNSNKNNLIFEPSSGIHTHSIIFMPGLTNTPEDFAPVLTQNLTYLKQNTTRLIILRSPIQKVSVLDGKENYSWFDIYYFPINSSSSFNFNELKEASNTLRQVINEEAKELGGKYDKIYIGGHSQGAMISLYTGYNFEHLLGGIISFSGILPPQGEVLPGKEDLNVYCGFGDSDNIITPDFFYETIESIKNYKGFNLYIYPNHTHSVILQEIIDAGDLLNKIM